jgi:hypothetical protein
LHKTSKKRVVNAGRRLEGDCKIMSPLGCVTVKFNIEVKIVFIYIYGQGFGSVSVTDVFVYKASRNDENGSIKLFQCLMSCVYPLFEIQFIIHF